MLTVEIPRSCPAERRYVLDVVIGDWLGLEYRVAERDLPDVRMRYGDGPALELADVFLAAAADSWLSPATLPQSPLRRWMVVHDVPGAITEAGDLPLLFAASAGDGRLIERHGQGLRCAVDLLGSIFFLLTRYEELVVSARDHFGRFPATASLAAREGFLERPLANEYAEVLWALLREVAPGAERRVHHYRVLLSHDVDSPSGAAGFRPGELLRSLGADLLKRFSPELAARRIVAAVTAPFGVPRWDPHDTFDFIMEQSEKRGLASAFNFICGHTGGRIDGCYDISEGWLLRLIARVHVRGHEIGLHPSFETWRDPQALVEEFRRLRAAAAAAGVTQEQWGGRQHFLRWQAPDTWRHWAEAGLGYDSSVGYADRAGFRCGACWEFSTYDVSRRHSLALRERPLIVMDASLLQPAYMGLTLRQAVEFAASLASCCRRYGGDFTLLWHNHFLIERAQRAAYVELLNAVA